MISRRAFLKAGGVSLFGIGMGGIPAFLMEAVAQVRIPGVFKKRKTLVCIFQRGAMDGLMAVTPYEDPYLKAMRPGLFMSAARAGNTPSLVDLDGRFGLHPGMDSLTPFFKSGHLAIVHGMGSPNKSRSHFDAQDFMETGTPFKKGTPDGWLNRALGLTEKGNETPFQGVSITSALPRSFYGEHPAVAIRSLADFKIQDRKSKVLPISTAQSFEALYDEAATDLLKNAGKDSFDALKMIDKGKVLNYQPENGAVYPSNALGNALKQIAQLIKMEVGLEVAFAESGGWDTHVNQGTSSGIFARNVQGLSEAIAAFWKDLERYRDEVTVMTMTEFGRTVAQNGTGGTDHGRASCSFILGADVIGGKVYGEVAPLARENLEDGRDLAVTTDFRAVFSAVAGQHLNIHDTQQLFPGWEGEALSLMRKS